MTHPNLWAPWRMQYIKDLPEKGGPACFLCEGWRDPATDRELLVVHRGVSTMLILNRYPYTGGHLMAVPAGHVGDLVDLEPEGRIELIESVVLGEKLLQAAFNPQGMNIGMNIGRSAGAGLPGHLHVHIVPRWGGDTNFIDVVGGVRVIPEALEDTYARICHVLPKVLEA